MSDIETEETIADLLRHYVAEGDGQELTGLLDPLPRSAALREVLNLSAAERLAALSLISIELAAALIEEAPTELASELIERLDASRAAEIMDDLHSDVRADVIGELDAPEAEAILSNMDLDDVADVRRLIEYEDDTAGGLMASEVFVFHEDDTVGEVLRRFVTDEDDFERYRGQHPYVVNGLGAPVGVVSLRGLLTSRRSAMLTEIMTPPLTVSVDMALEDLQDIFDARPFLGLPVTEEDGTLVGVVSRSAVQEAVLKRAEFDGLKLQGVVGDELRSMPLAIRSRRRLAWLSTNIVLNIIAASVISAYEETLAAVIAIAVFLPMVSDMSGCSGNQAVAVTLRELALGLVKPVDAFRVWWKEASVGLINGVVLGLLIGIVAWIWKGNIYLGMVIGVALALNTLIAVSIGGVVPLLLRKFKQDPAVASGPLLTTITDMAGFFLVLSLASAAMPLLV